MAGSEFQLRIFGAGSVLEQPNRVKRVHAAMFAAGNGCAACGPVATMPCGNFLSADKIHKFAQYANFAAGVFFFFLSSKSPVSVVELRYLSQGEVLLYNLLYKKYNPTTEN